LTAGAASVAEGSDVEFTLTASVASDTDRTFQVVITGDDKNGTVGITKADAADFAADVVQTVVLLAGETTAKFSVTPVANDGTEGFQGFKVSLLDSGFNAVAASSTVVISDVTTDTEAPVVTAQTAPATYAENSAAGTVVATVAATDDTAVTGYTLTGNDAGFFAIDAAGNITLTEAGAAAGAASNDYETAPNSFTLGVVAIDEAGNESAAVNYVLNVTDVDDDAPQLVAATLSGTTLKLNFNEALQAGVLNASAFSVVDAANTSITVSSVTISGSTVTLALAATPSGATKVSYTPPATGTVLEDAVGNDVAAIVGQTVVTDATAPTLVSSSPADDSTAVAAGANVTLTFSENVILGTGNITLTNAADATDTRTIAVNDATQVSVSGAVVTINPTADLKAGATYYVNLPATAVLDAAGNAYAGITGTTALNFTVSTGPVVPPTPGKSFTLTTGNDGPGAISPAIDTTGTENNDTYNAVLDSVAANTSLNTGDVLRGNGGTGDVLNVTVTDSGGVGGANPALSLGLADIQGVEIFNIRQSDITSVVAAGGGFVGSAVAFAAAGANGDFPTANVGTSYGIDASLFAGLTNINNDRGAGNFEIINVSNTQQVGLIGNGSALAVGSLSASSVAAATTSTLNLSGGLQTSAAGAALQGAGRVTINGAAINTANINSSNGANVVGGVTYAGGAAVTTLNIKADSDFGLRGAIDGNNDGDTADNGEGASVITGFSAALPSTINVTGAGAVTVNVLDAALDTYNASTATGAQTLTLGAVGQNVTTGSGNDIITTGGIVLTGAVAAGAGTGDRLVVTATADLTAATGARYSGFEVVQAANGAVVDLSFLAGTNTITGVRIADGAAATGAINLSAAQAANVAITSAGTVGAITIGLTGAGNAGQVDTVKAALTTTTAAGALQNIDLATTPIVLTNIEKLELTGNGTVAATTGAVTLDTTAAVSLDNIKLTNAGNGNVITVAAGHQGQNLVLDASASSGTTTLDAGLYVPTGADLRGGTGADILQGSAQADKLAGGLGRDVFDFNTQVSTVAALDKISDFGKITVATADVLAPAFATAANFQAAGEVRGGVNADLLDISGVAAARALAVAAPVDVAAASGNAAFNITATLSARGVITLAGTDKAQIDTLAEFVAVANTAGLGIAAGQVAVFELNGNTYVFQEAGATDNVVELTGTTGVAGVSIIGAAGTGLLNEIFVL
ncbi:MAG: Ig-like domain-containing protein, partial [Comamonas sp.]|nr:Ig-like domain-containing protein [Comamonas sp.]